MRQLIIKDFRANWTYLLFVLAILFAISMAFLYNWIGENGRSDPGLVLYFLIVLLSSALVSMLFMKVDEVYRSDEIYASLPVIRSQIVIARHGSGAVVFLMSLTWG